MTRGTTAQFRFTLPYSKYDVDKVEVVLWQPNNSGLNEEFPLPIKKNYVQNIANNGSVITSGPWNWVDDYTLSVKIWEPETLTFSDKYKARVQLRGSANGLTFASPQEYITVYPIHGDDLMGDNIVPTPELEGWTVLDGEKI